MCQDKLTTCFVLILTSYTDMYVRFILIGNRFFIEYPLQKQCTEIHINIFKEYKVVCMSISKKYNHSGSCRAREKS